MRFVNDEEDCLSQRFLGFKQGLLDLGIDGAFADFLRKSQEPIQVVEQVCAAQGGQGGCSRV